MIKAYSREFFFLFIYLIVTSLSQTETKNFCHEIFARSLCSVSCFIPPVVFSQSLSLVSSSIDLGAGGCSYILFRY